MIILWNGFLLNLQNILRNISYQALWYPSLYGIAMLGQTVYKGKVNHML